MYVDFVVIDQIEGQYVHVERWANGHDTDYVYQDDKSLYVFSHGMVEQGQVIGQE